MRVALAFAVMLLFLGSVEASDEDRSGYVIGPGDQLVIHAVDVEELKDRHIPVDVSGYVRVPLVGRLNVQGLTVSEVETELAARLKKYVLRPDVSVSVVELRSQPVSIIGAVKNAGLHQVQGRKTLIEVLSLAGGLDPLAGPTLMITRRAEWGDIPLGSAVRDKTNQFSVAEVSIRELIEAKNPELNIAIKPYDVISVPKADSVYVVGQVQRAGAFVLQNREVLTVLQALSMAGGLDRTAQPQNARLLRRIPDAPDADGRTEVPVDVRAMLQGKIPDQPMQPEDILFVPDNLPKKAAIRAVETAIQLGTGILIFRR